MNNVLKIEDITLVRHIYKPDTILIRVDLPSSMPNVTKEKPLVSLRVTTGHGERYIKENFPDMKYEIHTEREKEDEKFGWF